MIDTQNKTEMQGELAKLEGLEIKKTEKGFECVDPSLDLTCEFVFREDGGLYVRYQSKREGSKAPDLELVLNRDGEEGLPSLSFICATHVGIKANVVNDFGSNGVSIVFLTSYQPKFADFGDDTSISDAEELVAVPDDEEFDDKDDKFYPINVREVEAALLNSTNLPIYMIKFLADSRKYLTRYRATLVPQTN